MNPSGDDLTLAPQSPAIGKGNNGFVPAGMTVDVAGNTRIVGNTVDLGAYEATSAAPPISISTMPVSASACLGGAATFAVTGASAGSNIVWQVNSGSGSADVVPGENYQFTVGTNSSVLTVSSAPPGTNYFRFRVTGSAFTSVPVSLPVNSPEVRYVNPAATTSTHDGLSWSNAFTDLHEALASVRDCSEVWVAAGTYTATAGTMLSLRSTVALYGGFAGNETNRSQRDWNLHPSVLTAASGSDLMHNDGDVAPIDHSAVLDGFIIRDAG